MFPDNAESVIVPIDNGTRVETALAVVTSNQQERPDYAAEMFARYKAAQAAGIFDKLADFIKEHGTLESGVIKWLVKRDGLELSLSYTQTGALYVSRNGEPVLDDAQGRNLIFEPGTQGTWLRVVFMEHESLVRDAEQAVILNARRAQNEIEARRNKFD